MRTEQATPFPAAATAATFPNEARPRTKNSRQFHRLTPERTRSACSLIRLASGDELVEQLVCGVARVLRRCNRHVHDVGLLSDLRNSERRSTAVHWRRSRARARRLPKRNVGLAPARDGRDPTALLPSVHVSEPAVPEGRPASRCRRLAAISDSVPVVSLRPSFMLHRIERLGLSRNRSRCELGITVVQTGRSSSRASDVERSRFASI
jgi:hypothetical protein